MDRLTAECRSALMASVRTKNTSPEVEVRSLIHRMGFRFRLHRRELPGKPDLVFSSRKKVIFVHGCFWHGHRCPRGKLPSSNVAFWMNKMVINRKRDVRNLGSLKILGWQALVVWECELKNSSRIEKKLRRFLSA